MRIAYLAHISGGASSGVFHKVAAQMGRWASGGHHARLFLLTRDDPGIWHARFTDAQVRSFTDPRSRFGWMLALTRELRAFHPDVIYQRYFPFYPTMGLLLHHRLVVEVNTDDRAEYVLASRTRDRYNRLTRGLILGRARAIVFVTRELSESHSFRGFRGRHVVITNGVDLADYPSLPAPSNDVPRLVFIGSPEQPWQGFDKVVRLANLRPGWQFDVVGVDALGDSPANVTWHGPLPRDGVIEVLARSDVGIGTLALHRKGLREASPLKVREYLAVGLPVLYAYLDPDADVVDGPRLRIANTESNVDDEIDRIDAFVTGAMGRRIPRDSVSHIDVAAKEAQRIAVFEEVVERG